MDLQEKIDYVEFMKGELEGNDTPLKKSRRKTAINDLDKYRKRLTYLQTHENLRREVSWNKPISPVQDNAPRNKFILWMMLTTTALFLLMIKLHGG